MGLILVCMVGLLRVAKAQKRNDAETRRVPGIAKLHEMVCQLRLGMSKVEVEHELGKGTYSPTRGVFYYPVDAEDDDGVPFGLVVEYRRLSYKDGEDAKQTGKLEEFRVGRIAE